MSAGGTQEDLEQLVDRAQFNEEIVVVYNSAVSETKEVFIEIDYRINKHSKKLQPLYGCETCIDVLQPKNGSKKRYIRLYLQPMQIVIFQSS